jgi:hypothetical protein
MTTTTSAAIEGTVVARKEMLRSTRLIAFRFTTPGFRARENQARRLTGRGEMPGRLEVLSSLSRSDYLIYGRGGGQPLRLSLTPPRRPEFARRSDERRAFALALD